MSLIRSKNVIFFPVEITVRELDFRLILAILCVRPGWQVIIGEHEQLFPITLRMKNAILVLKNVVGGKRPWKYRRYKDLGHRIIQLDEESGIFEGDKDFWRKELDRRLDVRGLDAEDYVCAWGAFQAEHYKSLNPACADHIIATGHPRMELGSPRFNKLYQAEADELQARFGDFILINTNLVANNARGIDVLLVSHKIDPEDTEYRTRIIEQGAYEVRRAGHFIELINHLSNAFPGRQIVVRPHPSEDIRRYQDLFRFVPRVTVTRDGSLYAWLLACSLLVHGGCTTAIEAHVVGKPIINFHPVVDERFDIFLPNLLGVTRTTPQEVSATIRELELSGTVPELDPVRAAQLEEILCNLDGKRSGFDRITEIIGQCQDECPPTICVGPPPFLLLQRLRDTLGRFTRSSKTLRRIFHSRDTGEHKFPPLDRKEVLRKVEIIRQITGKQVKIHFHAAKIFSVTLD